MRTAFTCQVRSFPVASFQLEENAAAFLGGGYFLRFKIPKTTVASSIRSVSTSIVVMRVTPLFRGNNLAVPYQQLHYSIHGFILSINRSSGRLLCICLVFHPITPKQAHLSVCLFPYITLYPFRPAGSYQSTGRSDIVLAAMTASTHASGNAHCALPSPVGASLGNALSSSFAAAKPSAPLSVLSSRSSAEATPPATSCISSIGAARPLEPPPEQQQEQLERKQQRNVAENVHERAQTGRCAVYHDRNNVRERNELQPWLRRFIRPPPKCSLYHGSAC